METIDKMSESWKNISKLFANGVYRGKLIAMIKITFKMQMEIIKRNELHTFKVLPKRWIVEKPFYWIDANRRNSKNYKRLNNTAVSIVHLASIRIILNHF